MLDVRPKVFILGFKSELARPEYLVEPMAPSNYGAEAAARYVARVKEQRLLEAVATPIVATLTDLAIYDENLKQLGRFMSRKTADVARDFFTWCVSNLPAENFYGSGNAVPMYGFRIHDMLRVAALECLAAHPKVVVPFNLWHAAGYVHDIFEYLIPSELRKLVGLTGLVRFLTGESVVEEMLYNDVHYQARLTRTLLDRVQLLEQSSPRPVG